MPYSPGTGNGATLTLSVTTFAGQYEEIDPGEDKLGVIEVSHLGTTTRKQFDPEDLFDAGEMKGTVQFDSSQSQPVVRTVETITLTFQKKAGQTTAGTLVGTAILTKFSRPKQMNNTKLMSDIEWKWNGKTGPVFTPGS